MIKLNKETVHVSSAAIKKAEYNYDNRVLKLIFANGSKYDYYNVPIDKFLSMKYSESIGKYINKYIIKKYDFSHAE